MLLTQCHRCSGLEYGVPLAGCMSKRALLYDVIMKVCFVQDALLLLYE